MVGCNSNSSHASASVGMSARTLLKHVDMRHRDEGMYLFGKVRAASPPNREIWKTPWLQHGLVFLLAFSMPIRTFHRSARWWTLPRDSQWCIRNLDIINFIIMTVRGIQATSDAASQNFSLFLRAAIHVKEPVEGVLQDCDDAYRFCMSSAGCHSLVVQLVRTYHLLQH